MCPKRGPQEKTNFFVYGPIELKRRHDVKLKINKPGIEDFFFGLFFEKIELFKKKMDFYLIFQLYLLIQFPCQNKNEMCFRMPRTPSITTRAIFFVFDRIAEKISKNL